MGIVKDLTTILLYNTPSFSFKHHTNVTVGRAIKILSFWKRNTLHHHHLSLDSLYFYYVRSILESFVFIMWPVWYELNGFKIAFSYSLSLKNSSPTKQYPIICFLSYYYKLCFRIFPSWWYPRCLQYISLFLLPCFYLFY